MKPSRWRTRALRSASPSSAPLSSTRTVESFTVMYSSHSDTSSFQLLPSQFQSFWRHSSFGCQSFCHSSCFQSPPAQSPQYFPSSHSFSFSFSPFRPCRPAPLSAPSISALRTELSNASTDGDIAGKDALPCPAVPPIAPASAPRGPVSSPDGAPTAFLAGRASPRASCAARRICRRTSPACFRTSILVLPTADAGGPTMATGSLIPGKVPPVGPFCAAEPPLKLPPPMGL
mmetsp:Transcript_5698/g.15780  ORF Transcript_5698/g.15780 Transcript_5698/m.15780 type:complete len:231 (+) Transcript_5698:1193-1885(+)